MKNMFKLALTGLALSSMALSSVAMADVNGKTKFSIELPNVLVLYHWDSATLDLSGTAIEQAIKDSTAVTKTADLANGPAFTVDGTASVDDSTSPTGFDPSTKLNVTLQNSWAVRSLSGTGGVNLAVSTPNGTDLTSHVNDKSIIEMSNVKLAYSGNTDTTLKLTSGWGSKKGDITFDLDLSNVTSSGVYSTGRNNEETFQLTLSAN